MKPLIGITAAHVEEEISTYPREFYVQAVIKAGGIPILLPSVTGTEAQEHYIALINGLILSGGSDVDPVAFGEEPLKGTGRVFNERDQFELELTRRALEKDKPVLGICRGAQVLNIALGGDIFQDICTQVEGVLEHSQKAPRSMAWHTVSLTKGSNLGKLFNSNEIRVNSFHHQAVKTPAPGFRVAGIAKDGIIEAIESTGHRFAIGVQWHPEALDRDSQAIKLFNAFINVCK